jgi:hypothetical protein
MHVDRTRCVRLFVLTLALATPLSAVRAFAQSPTFVRADVPLATNDLISADLNGDGRPDLVGLASMAAAVMLGNGDGTFQAIVQYPVFNWTQAVAAGDFNGDGRVDLIVTINDINTGLSLLTGRGDGTFNTAVNFPNTSRLDSPAIAATDLDNDGKLDIVVGHQIACYTAPCLVGRSITVMRGNGDGTFQPAREITVGSGISMIAVGDFNRDGIKDLGLASDSSRVYILLGAGDATFIQQPTMTMTADTLGVDATDIDIADFNGDAIQDLVVAVALNGSRTAILIGNGDGTFRAPSIITEPQIRVPQYQAVADYNGDGFQDLALSLGFGSNGLFEIRNGNGDGTFGPLLLYLVPPPLSSIGGIRILSTDFNGDGKPDLALNYGGASAAVVALRNTTGIAPATALSSVTLSPSTVVGGASSTARVTLSAAAPSGGAVVSLSSNSPAVVAPASVTVPAGSTSATAAITTATVNTSSTATVSAAYAGVTRSANLRVNAATPSAPSLVAPASGASVALPVTLDWNDVAAATSYEVQVDNSSNVSAPFVANPTVTASQAALSGLPAQQLWWRVRARNAAGLFGPFSSTRSFTPQAPAGGETLTVTVAATGRSGERITSSPAGINVSVGTTGSAPFAAGTSITLSVASGRDAIWSGVCSSGGSKTKACTFTPGSNATVTANVQ